MSGEQKGRPLKGGRDRYRHTADLYRQDVNLCSRHQASAIVGVDRETSVFFGLVSQSRGAFGQA